MTDYRAAYVEEASELLRELEVSLLALEKDAGDAETIGRVFRALHTVKGSGAMCGFDEIAAFTHQIETVFDQVRDGRLAATRELIAVTLDARDHIARLLEDSGVENLQAAGEIILERLSRIAPCVEADKPKRPNSPEIKAAVKNASRSFRIRFHPNADIFMSGTNPILPLRELSSLGECTLLTHLDSIPQLSEFNPDECYTHWDLLLTTTADENAIQDVFIFIEDRAKIDIQCIGEADRLEWRRLGEILVDRGDLDPADSERYLSSRPLAGEVLVEAGVVTPDRVDAALMEQRHRSALQEKQKKAETAATLRVPASKLDALVNIVGELVTVEARLNSYALASGESEVTFIAEEVERLTALLRENTMSLRMLPIGETFRRFTRLVHDLSAELGKKVELTTEGGETELDKTVIEQLSDPLVHLIRNAIDHGIESPAERLAAGKAEAGRVNLSACHSGAFVIIRVSDDGSGMNREAIRARAIERGMIAADAALGDEEIFALTLAPGFSTATRVTAVSGRGVGMDVVARSLEALRGNVSISSNAGSGTVVTLKIPLTLAIIDGLLLEAAGAYFVVPAASVSECIEMERRKHRDRRDSLVNVRGEPVPYISLRERFALGEDAPGIEHVIVAETRAGRCGFVVDRVIGHHSTVIKKLGNLYRDVEEVSGATMLGDGTIALILDVDHIARGVVQGT
jgi:two-component system chemotaxis sensor kinase CheA